MPDGPVMDDKHKAINPDDFLETDVGRIWTPERSAEAWRSSYEALDGALADHSLIRRVVIVCGLQGAGKTTWIATQPASGDAIYFDAALPGARHRRPIIEIARSRGASVEAVWIKASVDLALERNSARSADKKVPESSIRSVAAQFEQPTHGEGFDHVLIVDASSGAANRAR